MFRTKPIISLVDNLANPTTPLLQPTTTFCIPHVVILFITTYQGMTCKVAHAGQLSESFEVRTGVRQGCLLSPFLFLLVIDWIMKTTTTGRNNGIQWTLWTQLDDLDFADDLALLSHNHTQMQDKTTRLAEHQQVRALRSTREKQNS